MNISQSELSEIFKVTQPIVSRILVSNSKQSSIFKLPLKDMIDQDFELHSYQCEIFNNGVTIENLRVYFKSIEIDFGEDTLRMSFQNVIILIKVTQ